MGGGFEPVAKPVFHEGIPDKFEFQLLPEDWDHFRELHVCPMLHDTVSSSVIFPLAEVLLDQMLHRLPSLAEAEVRQLTNGPESFTPDGKYILGRAPEVGSFLPSQALFLIITLTMAVFFR